MSLLRRLRDEKDNPALCGDPFAGRVRAKVCAYADDITVFVSRHLDILAVKKAVERYKEVAGIQKNFDKSESLQLGAWRGAPSARALPLEQPTSPHPLASKAVVLKGRAEVSVVYIFPLILYHLSVLPGWR